MTKTGVIVLLAFILVAVNIHTGRGAGPIPPAVAKNPPDPKFAGSVSCRECHERFYKLWAPSHHGLAMQPYSPEFARKNLIAPKAAVKAGGHLYRLELGGKTGFVCEKGSAGEKKYPILHALGGKNVYYFLSPAERGRLQTLPVAYDVSKKEWFDTAASGLRHFSDDPDGAVNWQDPAYTFNTSCHSCHVSQLSTNYDPKADTYRTTWAEAGINCETCHGPAQEHIRAAHSLKPGEKLADLKLISAKPFSHEQRNTMCAPCHAKMVPIGNSFKSGERYFDHYDLVTLENPDFYPDGRDLGENYTFTLWRMSPCAKSGQLDCLHCHTSSGRYRFKEPAQANAACLPCHEAKVKDPAAHTHHPAGKPGGRCIDCHMPKTEFARMARSDHSMRPPMPAATLAFKSPNACNLCHKDKDAAWADKQVRAWRFRDYQAPTLAWARLVSDARRSDWSRLPAMLAYLKRPDRDEIVANSLIRLMRPCTDPRKGPALLEALQDPSPLVRSSAAEALSDALTPESVTKLLTAARDPYRLVRIRSVAALAGAIPQLLETGAQKDLAPPVEEFKLAMQSRPDDFAGYYNLGNFYLAGRDPGQATQAFETAIRLRPDSVLPLVNASLAYSLAGRSDKAEESLRRALKIAPGNATANINLGMLLGEQNRLDEAEAAFLAALKTEPQSAVAAYNLGVIVSRDRPEEAIKLCRLAQGQRPDEPKYGYTLAFYLRQKGDGVGAMAALREVLRRNPGHVDSILLLGELYKAQGRGADATALYLKALQNTRLPAADRQRILESAR